MGRCSETTGPVDGCGHRARARGGRRCRWSRATSGAPAQTVKSDVSLGSAGSSGERRSTHRGGNVLAAQDGLADLFLFGPLTGDERLPGLLFPGVGLFGGRRAGDERAAGGSLGGRALKGSMSEHDPARESRASLPGAGGTCGTWTWETWADRRCRQSRKSGRGSATGRGGWARPRARGGPRKTGSRWTRT